MATQYRDLVSPTLLQTGLSDSSAAQSAARLSAVFTQFENNTNDFIRPVIAGVGARAGSEEGAAGKPKPRSGLAATTAFGQAYNSAAEVTYSNKLQTDLTTQLDSIEQQAGTDTAKYAQLSRAVVEGTVKDAPPEWRVHVQQMVQPQVNAGAARVAKMAHAQMLDEAAASYGEWMPSAVTQYVKDSANAAPEEADAMMATLVLENDAKLERLEADGAISAVQRVKLRQGFIDSLDQAVASSHITAAVAELTDTARVNVERADAAFADVMSREDLSPEEKVKIGSMYRENVHLLNFERSRQYLDQTTALSRRLTAGEAGLEGEAKRLYRLGALTPEGYQGAIDQSTRNAKVKDEKNTLTDALSILETAGNLGLDPGSTDHRKAVSTAFEAAAENQGWLPGDANFRANALAFADKWNILPGAAESWARVALVSNDPVAAADAARFMAQVRDAKPHAYAWNNEPKLEVLASNISDNLNAGMDASVAYELARNVYDMKPAEKQILEDEYRKLIEKDPNSDVIAGELNAARHWWQSDLPIPPKAKAEYSSLVEQYFLHGKDLEGARKLAGERMAKEWGPTYVNGVEEIVKNPPEGLGVSAAIVREDMAAELQRVRASQMDHTKVKLVPTEATDRTRGMVWGLGTEDQYGNPDIVIGPDGRPLGYMLPVGTAFDAAVAAHKAKKVAEAEAALRFERVELPATKRDLGTDYLKRDMP